MLKVKLLDPDVRIPTVGYPGEDLGYDLYANEQVMILPGETRSVRLGICIEFDPPAGGLLFTRASMAEQSCILVSQVVNAGYRGELSVMLHNLNRLATVQIRKGYKVAQLVRCPNVADEPVTQSTSLSVADRGAASLGSTGTGLLGRPE